MSTPEEEFEIAVDDSRPTDARREAIDGLEAANECDRLSTLVRRDDIDDEYRELAMEGLAHPQCKRVLETLVEDGDVPDSLRERAETLLSETPDEAGPGH